MSRGASDASKSSNQIEVMQNLFEEILQIQKENKTTDEAFSRVKEIIEESSSVVENSTSPNEMIVDAKILQTGSTYINTNVTSLNTNLASFNESTYISGVLSFIENSTEIFPSGKEWEALACVSYEMFKKSHPLTFFLGTFEFEPPPPKEKVKSEKKQGKKGAEAEKKVLSRMTTEKEQQVEEGSDIYDHILKWLVRQYKRNGKQPVGYFNFILDPSSYWRTIENIFHFAFLVRDGSVKMEVVNGLPVVEPILKQGEERGERSMCNNQFCFSLSVKEWEESIERFQVESASIPPFVRRS